MVPRGGALGKGLERVVLGTCVIISDSKCECERDCCCHIAAVVFCALLSLVYN